MDSEYINMVISRFCMFQGDDFTRVSLTEHQGGGHPSGNKASGVWYSCGLPPSLSILLWVITLMMLVILGWSIDRALAHL